MLLQLKFTSFVSADIRASTNIAQHIIINVEIRFKSTLKVVANFLQLHTNELVAFVALSFE